MAISANLGRDTNHNSAKLVCAHPLLAANKIGDSRIKSDMKQGQQSNFGAKSQSEGSIQLVAANNGDNYSTALKRNMENWSFW